MSDFSARNTPQPSVVHIVAFQTFWGNLELCLIQRSHSNRKDCSAIRAVDHCQVLAKPLRLRVAG